MREFNASHAGPYNIRLKYCGPGIGRYLGALLLPVEMLAVVEAGLSARVVMSDPGPALTPPPAALAPGTHAAETLV